MVKSIVLSPQAPKKTVDLKSCLHVFRKHTKHPEVFLKVQKQLSNDLKLLLKQVYDHGAKADFILNDAAAPYLDELVTEQMDEEQIWQQLELKNEYFVEQDLKKMSELLSKREEALQLEFSAGSKSDYGSQEEPSAASQDEDDENEFDEEPDEEMDDEADEEMDEEAPEKVKKQKKSPKEKKKGKSKSRSIVDDKFFKLDDMARFLDEEDERERRRQNGLKDINPLIEIDYFDEHTGVDDGDDDDDGEGMKYSDFFEDDEDEDEDSSDENDEDDESGGDDNDEENENGMDGEAEQSSEDSEGEEEEGKEKINGTKATAEEEELSDEAEVERNRQLRYEIYKSEGGFVGDDLKPPTTRVSFGNVHAKAVERDGRPSSDSEGENDEDKNEEDDAPKAAVPAEEEEEELSEEAELERNLKLRYEIFQSQGGAAKKVSFKQPDASDDEHDHVKARSDEIMSSFELRQQKMQQKIAKMEEKLLQEKPWQLKGEISAETRPQNSLLEEVLEFENTTRSAPVISEETTMRLEDIIKQRIRNKAFDDVERKVRPPDNPREYRKQLVLDGEKSKESLAQVYEQDYLKQLEKANPDNSDQPAEEPKEHKEIRRMMKIVMAQLDALTNFHYTPRPAVPEVKILTNTPAIVMEEVAPVSVSDANLLAPEEVHNRSKGDVMSKEERTATDKKRERRLKKRFQQEKFRREAEREQKQLQKAARGSGGNSKQNRALQTSLLKKVTQAKNVQQMAVSAGPAKSSTAFFSQLQDEVRTQVKAKANAGDKKKKNADHLQATSLKL